MTEPITGSARATYVTAPSTDQVETAWWNLMQGELGLDHDDRTREFVQTMVDHVRQEGLRGFPIMDADGEPLLVVSAEEMAKRVAAAYAVLFYGN